MRHSAGRRPAPRRRTTCRRRTAKLLTGVLALLLLVMPTTAGQMNLASSTYLCTGYPGCQAAGYGNGGYRQASLDDVLAHVHRAQLHQLRRVPADPVRACRTSGPGRAAATPRTGAWRWQRITDQIPTVGSVAWYKPHVTPAGSPATSPTSSRSSPTPRSSCRRTTGAATSTGAASPRPAAAGRPGSSTSTTASSQPTSAPAIAGTPAVGAPLEVAAGAWTPAPTSVTVPLARRRCRHPGATGASYVPTPDVKGKALTAEVTAQLERLHRRARRRSPPRPSPPARSRTPQLPAIQGAPEVGQTLTLTPTRRGRRSPRRSRPSGTPTASPLAGATGSSLTLTRDHIDQTHQRPRHGQREGLQEVEARPRRRPRPSSPSPSRSPPVPRQGRARGGRAGSSRGPGRVRPERRDGHATSWLRDGQPHRQGHAPHLHGPPGRTSATPCPSRSPWNRRNFRDDHGDPSPSHPRHDRSRGEGPHRGHAGARRRRHPRQGAWERPGRTGAITVSVGDARSRASSSTGGRASSYVTSGRARSRWSCATRGPTSCSPRSRARA